MSGNAAAAVLTKPAFRKIHWLERDIAVERRPDGVIVLKSRIPLKAYEKHLPASLAKWAQRAARRRLAGAARRRRPAMAQAVLWRGQAHGRRADAGAARSEARAGQPGRDPLGNSIEHALMTMAAMQARFPAAPVSPAYSLMSQDHLKLKYLFDLIKPKVVMVQDGPTFEKALKALDLDGVTVIHVVRPCEGIKSIAFADLAATPVTSDVENSIAGITPDTVGKLLFTSGSTGMPKAVINTQEMMCANAAMMMQVPAARFQRAAGDLSGLDAVESHHGRQRAVQSGADRRRHALHRRRPPDAGPDRRDAAKICARSRRPITPTCRRAMPRSPPRWKRTMRCAAASSKIWA